MGTSTLGHFSRRTMGFAAAAVLLAASAAAQAGEPATPQDAAATAPVSVLDQAISDIRVEQRRAMQQAARVALAGLRSETRTALSQGATAGGSASVQARP